VTRRLLLGYLGVTLFVLVSLEVPLGVQNQRTERHDLTANVSHDAMVLAADAEDAVQAPTRRKKQLNALAAVVSGYAKRTGARVVIVDRRGRIGPGARLFAEAGPVVVYTAGHSRDRHAELERAGAEVVRRDRIELDELLSDLRRRGVQSVLVEGGGGLAGAFGDAGLWDRVVAFVAPLVIGGAAAPGGVAGEGAETLAAAARLSRIRTRRFGPDIGIEGIRSECLRELSSSVAG